MSEPSQEAENQRCGHYVSLQSSHFDFLTLMYTVSYEHMQMTNVHFINQQNDQSAAQLHCMLQLPSLSLRDPTAFHDFEGHGHFRHTKDFIKQMSPKHAHQTITMKPK